jgi:hypothetical protein
MTPEELRLLVETRDLALENAKTLKSIQRSLRASMIVKVVYWVIILGITFGAFYLIQPYIDFLTGSIGGLQENASSIDSFSIKGAVKNFQELQGLYK